ncbi:MAG: DUF975 family protein [Clostridia bacterium]|nr:DUF975 family protein [Clostridia bacterium]
MQGNMLDENIIIKEPSKNLRTLGRNALSGKWKIAIITMCVYLLIQSVPPAIFDAIFGTNVVTSFSTSGDTYGLDANTYAEFLNNMPQYCALSSLYTILVAGALNLGLALFALGVFRGAELHVSDILLGFEKFGKALGLYLFQTLFITLWTLLFIVPGIIAAIRYSQAFFILADDSSKGIRQCMDESKAMMRGNKSKYFCLALSFIGWCILSGIPSSIVSNIGNVVSHNAFILSIFAIIGSLFLAPVIAYIYSTLAGFYEILAGHLIKETLPIPVTAEEAQKAYAELNAVEEEEEPEEEQPAEAPVEEVQEEESAEEVKEESDEQQL